MPTYLLPVHEGLRGHSRWAGLVRSWPAAAEWSVLVGCGVLAAVAVTRFDMGLRIPGHAILRAVMPLGIGLALVPRRGSGCVMSAAAGAGLLGLGWIGAGAPGVGAMTSLLATGPLLDLATAWSKRGWQLYVSLAGAGLAANLLALLVRWGEKAGGGHAAGRALAAWLPQAPFTYAACGLAAGLITAGICFRAVGDQPSERRP